MSRPRIKIFESEKKQKEKPFIVLLAGSFARFVFAIYLFPIGIPTIFVLWILDVETKKSFSEYYIDWIYKEE